MTAYALTAAGCLVLLFAWAGPLPRLVPGSFAAHMALHMLVVGIGVPLLAAGLAPAVRRWLAARPRIVIPIMASLVDFVVVWLWHWPALHHASRMDPFVLGVEQTSFAAAALLLWLVAFCAPPLIGALELFFTSMHMVLLGALLGLSPRAIYDGHAHGSGALTALQDQHLGGVIMFAIGGVTYLGGGLFLASRVLRRVPAT